MILFLVVVTCLLIVLVSYELCLCCVIIACVFCWFRRCGCYFVVLIRFGVLCFIRSLTLGVVLFWLCRVWFDYVGFGVCLWGLVVWWYLVIRFAFVGIYVLRVWIFGSFGCAVFFGFDCLIFWLFELGLVLFGLAGLICFDLLTLWVCFVWVRLFVGFWWFVVLNYSGWVILSLLPVICFVLFVAFEIDLWFLWLLALGGFVLLVCWCCLVAVECDLVKLCFLGLDLRVCLFWWFVLYVPVFCLSWVYLFWFLGILYLWFMMVWVFLVWVLSWFVYDGIFVGFGVFGLI